MSSMDALFVGGFKRLVLLIVLTYLHGSQGTRHVSVTIPIAAKTRDTVSLQCRYDLEGEPLYTLKWYKGAKEFYRYIPKELPSTQIFPLPGINVDTIKSNPNNLVLTNIQSEVTGRYKCEVSSDAPNFYTFMESGYMYVVDVPEDDPTMVLEKDLMEIGHVLKGNCTAPPSYPPANITWFLNGKKINESMKRTLPAAGQTKLTPSTSKRVPQVTFSGIEVEVDERSFYGGKARFMCEVTVFNLYKRQKEIEVEEDRPRPRPSSVLGNRDTSAGSTYRPATANFIICLLFVLQVCQR
ncbi:uncharacterized protein LOC114336588 [Diabrotica virgifera virgifera]|uniref:Ig-like domain-containing protein n=1 Tax=Diabrotica virgifera virgifera TaxID=50390 RepID=A0ABM5KYL7_DIAVI|nr:uncharacterized protein LOC114336588 [Diabrotica virgifera virgifera]